MLKGIKQSDKELLLVIQDYGCLFLKVKTFSTHAKGEDR